MPIKINVKQCSICLDKIHMKADSCTTLCKHTFHKTCIDTWNKSVCPVCRQETGLTVVVQKPELIPAHIVQLEEEVARTHRARLYAQERIRIADCFLGNVNTPSARKAQATRERETAMQDLAFYEACFARARRAVGDATWEMAMQRYA